MSILRFISGKNHKIIDLARVLFYITDSGKILPKWIFGEGLCSDTAYTDMLVIKGLHRKMDGRQFIHFFLSFDAGVEAEKALEVCKKATKYYEEKYQILAAVHTNTDNVHCHYVLNTVSIRGGEKYEQKKGDLYSFRRYINKLLREEGLNPIEKAEEAKAEDVLDMDVFDDFPCDENGEDDWHLLHHLITFHQENDKKDEQKILSAPVTGVTECDTGNRNNIAFQSGIFQTEKRLFQPIRFIEEEPQFPPIRFIEEELQFPPIRFIEEKPRFQPIIFHTNAENGENNIL